LVNALVQPTSVVDVGCGIGTWLKAFAECGVDNYLGLDGDYVPRNKLLIEASRFQPVDLTNPPDLNRKFDLAVCLEVGEHLPARSAPRLVTSLTTFAPCVLFSAALPGQGGTHHINEQWPAFWQRLFAAREFVRLDPIRPQVWRNRSVEWWYKQNIYLYCHKDKVASKPALSHEADYTNECPFELLHADVLSPFTTARGLARSLLKAVPRALGRLIRPIR
jgi:SAM-dependent methyltransferase